MGDTASLLILVSQSDPLCFRFCVFLNCITYRVSDFMYFQMSPHSLFNSSSETMALTQKNVSRGADNYRQIVKVVCCIITCKSDKMVGAKIHFIISSLARDMHQSMLFSLSHVCLRHI